VAERLDFVPRRAAWTYLKRLWRFGLLERGLLAGTLKYKISEKGLARLHWLRSRVKPVNQEPLISARHSVSSLPRFTL
jgi:hypothetical protein